MLIASRNAHYAKRASAESDNFYVFRVARRLVGPSVRSRQNVEFPLSDKEPFATGGVFFPSHTARTILPVFVPLEDITNDRYIEIQ